jgi:hypothetical protein
MVVTRTRTLIIGVVVLIVVALLALPAVVLAGESSGATSPVGNPHAVSPSKRAHTRAESPAGQSRSADHLECSKRRAARIQDPSL